MGNLHSVQQAFKRLNQSVEIVRTPDELNNCKALLLPGVGAFDPAMEQLKKRNLSPEIKKWVKNEKPLLGICLGLQLLFESSDEGISEGLGLMKGHVARLPENQNERIPHMGWQLLKPTNNCPLIDKQDTANWMYFVHSYSAIPQNKKELAATANFGSCDVTAIVWQGKFGACQFHPEKSGEAGERLLLRWLAWLRSHGLEEL